jgi:hypothetical protein
MDKQLEEIERCIPCADVTDSNISLWSVGRQVEHILLTDKGILEHILANYTSPPESGKGTTWLGYLMLWTGYIPRGKGKAPEQVVPQDISKKELKKLHAKVCRLYLEAYQKGTLLDQSLFAFPHPYFGMLTVKQWFRFLEVHTHHHLKIIRELLHSKKQNS